MQNPYGGREAYVLSHGFPPGKRTISFFPFDVTEVKRPLWHLGEFKVWMCSHSSSGCAALDLLTEPISLTLKFKTSTSPLFSLVLKNVSTLKFKLSLNSFKMPYVSPGASFFLSGALGSLGALSVIQSQAQGPRNNFNAGSMLSWAVCASFEGRRH